MGNFMYLVVVKSDQVNDIVEKYSQYTNLTFSMREIDSFAAYDFSDGTFFTQAQDGILLSDNNYPFPLKIIRNFVLASNAPLSFMHIEDGMMLEVLPATSKPTKSQLDNFTITCGESLNDFVTYVSALLELPEVEEEDEDIYEIAHAFAFEKVVTLHSLGDQFEKHKIAIAMPSPIDETFKSDKEKYRKITNNYGEVAYVIIGNTFYIVFDEKFEGISTPGSANLLHAYSGELATFYNADEEMLPNREDVVKIARGLCSAKVPLILLDIDDNSLEPGAQEHGYWQQKFTYDGKQVVEAPDFWEP